jgi:spore coat polysaccharide biosynthesis predicted glycosyltransferase SpsG
MILYRTQGSAEIGFGHIKRAVYLASLIKKKNDILFVLKKYRSAINYFKEKGFKIILCLLITTPTPRE